MESGWQRGREIRRLEIEGDELGESGPENGGQDG